MGDVGRISMAVMLIYAQHRACLKVIGVAKIYVCQTLFLTQRLLRSYS